MEKRGTFVSFSLAMLLQAPTYIAYAFVNHNNFLWLMTLVRLSQHAMGMLLTYSASNIIYISLPPKDQTNYISFNTVVSNAAVFFSMLTGTGIVAAMGDSTVPFLGSPMNSVQLLLLATGVLLVGFGVLIVALRRKLPQESIRG